jgi:hypothetical protein
MHDICSGVVPFAATASSGLVLRGDTSFSFGIARAHHRALSVSLPHFLLVCNSVSEPFEFVKARFRRVAE